MPQGSGQLPGQGVFKFAVQGSDQRFVVALVPGALRAQHEAHEAGRSAQRAAVENPLPQSSFASSVEPEHGAGQTDFGRIAGIGRADRLVGVFGEHGGDGGGFRLSGEQTCGVLRGKGENDAIEQFALDRKIRAEREGTFNAIRLLTHNILSIDDHMGTFVTWANQFLVLPVENPVAVSTNEMVPIKFAYRSGDELEAFTRGLSATEPMTRRVRKAA